MRKFILLTAVLLLSSIALSVSAALVPPDTAAPNAEVCYPSCGDFIVYCMGVERTTEATHPMMVGGYQKTCAYTVVEGYTCYRCRNCGNRFAQGFHPHGERNHTNSGSSNCGHADYSICAYS